MKFGIIILSFVLFQACSSPVSTEEDSRSTIISFAVPEAGHVHVWVENAYQTKVKTVVNEPLPAGTHGFPFEMKDKKGKPLPYGMYTYYIETDTHSVSRTLFFSPRQSI